MFGQDLLVALQTKRLHAALALPMTYVREQHQ